MKEIERLHMTLPAYLKEAMQEAATKKQVSLSEHIKDLMKQSLKLNNNQPTGKS